MFWIILIIFFSHWFVSLFFHTTFLHRYASHQMFRMSKFWERVFYFCTWFFQGSSFLVPRAYAVMHRMHHEYSDTEADPHSPHFFKDVFLMMRHTKTIYNSILTGTKIPEPKFLANLPKWDALDRFGDNWIIRICWGVLYSLVYLAVIIYFKLTFFWLLLLPIHYLIGPVQGAFVNWCGHKYGYQNFNNNDHSHNTFPIGFFLLGELFQNNHHKYPLSINFAKKWYEIDFAYPLLKILHWIKIIRIMYHEKSEN